MGMGNNKARVRKVRIDARLMEHVNARKVQLQLEMEMELLRAPVLVPINVALTANVKLRVKMRFFFAFLRLFESNIQWHVIISL